MRLNTFKQTSGENCNYLPVLKCQLRSDCHSRLLRNRWSRSQENVDEGSIYRNLEENRQIRTKTTKKKAQLSLSLSLSYTYKHTPSLSRSLFLWSLFLVVTLSRSFYFPLCHMLSLSFTHSFFSVTLPFLVVICSLSLVT